MGLTSKVPSKLYVAWFCSPRILCWLDSFTDTDMPVCLMYKIHMGEFLTLYIR